MSGFEDRELQQPLGSALDPENTDKEVSMQKTELLKFF
jgi:hypothetical protein